MDRRQLLVRHSLTNKLAGFTIIELVVTIAISGILMTMIFTPLNQLYNDNTKGLKSVIKVADTKGVLRSIEHSLALSYGFHHTNPIADPFGTIWSWAGTGATSRVLITSNYATDIEKKADTANARTLVKDATCTTPLLNYNIYFVSGGTLYRRTIKNPAATCGGIPIAQPQTCPVGFNNPACTGRDAVLLTNVTNFTVDYYAEANDSVTMADQYTVNTVPSGSKAIVITLTANSGTSMNDTSTTSKIRVARLNGSDL